MSHEEHNSISNNSTTINTNANTSMSSHSQKGITTSYKETTRESITIINKTTIASSKADSSQEGKGRRQLQQQLQRDISSSEKDISKPIIVSSNTSQNDNNNSTPIDTKDIISSLEDNNNCSSEDISGANLIKGNNIIISDQENHQEGQRMTKNSNSRNSLVSPANQQPPQQPSPSNSSSASNTTANSNNTTTTPSSSSNSTLIYANGDGGGPNNSATPYEEVAPVFNGPSVPFQYYTGNPQFFPGSAQYFFDPRFPRPPHISAPPLPPPNQPAFSPTPSTLMTPPHPHPHNTTNRYLNPGSAAGGDSGFSSRRSSLDQIRIPTPVLGPQYSPRVHQKKPKQLDKALWVGNLPDSTTHEELQEFFADESMESVFLIKKSNCAFVNYKTHEAVVEAEKKYNDAEFKDIKLVCRPRKNNPSDFKNKIDALTAITSQNTPLLTPSEAGSTTSSARSQRSSLPPPRQRFGPTSHASMSPASSVSSNKPSPPNRYFILKSLTQDDLDISVESGVWATQPHNETFLNKAFKSAENVYLIFSANKSGEFYGYARMASPINKETTESIQWTPVDEATLAASSSRPSVQEEVQSKPKRPEDDSEDCDEDGVPSRNWGTAFKVEWIKVQKLPFVRTRHLRNPWNANREVKISRDGTEVEPAVGAKLLSEFHKTSPQLAYTPMAGPLLAQPLNLEATNIADGQERQIPSPSGTTSSLQGPMPPMMDINYMQNPQPAFFPPPPPGHYWHPQPILMPSYGTGPTPTGYVPGSVPTPRPLQNGGIVANPNLSPMLPIDQQQQQQYVEAPVPPHHPNHYQPTHALPHPPHHFQSSPISQTYYRPEENRVDNQIMYQPQQQSSSQQSESSQQVNNNEIESSVLLESSSV
ncbi:2846_t:CDS:10 [Ambispora gerdemannii]|uniref:2846_t:CDS:1 n=1 Tax=Ambispora gerdemannii TaxID=144530 RepID=A0A9N8ZWU3_9GLOM|nr:2846_t:CDS:10 [Ambispora gerdemannii]